MKRMIVCLMCLALVLGLSGPACAAQGCALRVRLLDQEKTVSGGSMTIYLAADENGVLTADFAPSGAVLGDLNDPALAESLAGFAGTRGLAGTAAIPGADGVMVFSGLKAGVYLLTQETASEGYYPISPFLLRLDGVNDLEAEPKVEPLPDVPAEPVDVSVKKVWSDSGKDRPGSVTVGLFAGEDQVDAVKLSDENHWEHTWKDLDGSKEYTVKELKVPRGYTATYRTSGNVVTVTNTATLIQTGQLNWPVPILAVSGLVLLMLGMVLLRRKDP